MNKNIAYKGLALMLFCVLLFLPGCQQSSGSVRPEKAALSPASQSSFNMGGVDIQIPGPAGYINAPEALLEAVAQAITPAENIFAVYVPASESELGEASGQALLRNRRIIVVSARPEFMNESIDASFFGALRRDISRVNGSFGPERLTQFRVLTEHYYEREDSFAHSLGVFDSRRGSVSVARILRQAASHGAGAVSSYAAKSASQIYSRDLVLQNWDKKYFSSAYYQVGIQNMLAIDRRCFNIYFFAPLAEEADIYELMDENREYMNAIARSAAELNALAGAGQNPAQAKSLLAKAN